MAIRHNFYTMYEGKEYRIARIDGHYEIITNDVEALNSGFIEYKPEENLNPRIFFKMVSPEEVGDVYKISTYALYQGYEFWIKWAGDGNYILKGNNNTVLMEKLDFKRVDKYDYEKIVKQEDVDLVYEKKTLLTDFFD
ncbi:hypothetical protein BWD09_11790 [Neisseria dentiae]|uniref:Uncharacterized protein n=1 Tax=Neisseria dentiae TaxID=194197 RepID=A0A1X3D238_9NEIS|nr:hypothetical protein [Neisseria dentiae]OSI13989.1 hypothetical protein BWD09_11790 [Neisseria dentiae]QMT44904.1 hypothetical protein H3L92_10850 [Neisseria dentiae]STZ50639.1 Uncharacterised protein [Neisseria dentiae]